MRRGLALILVVGVLAILAVLGSAFAVLSRLERKAAAQRVLGTQAFLLARSGLEDAQARLDAGQDPDYGGEDWDGIGAALSPFEAAQELYKPGSLDRDACPVAQAMRPSFFVRMGSGEPVTVPVQDRMRGFSGRLGGSLYTLKVTTGGFYVNGGDPASPVTATTDYNLTLKRMLGVLTDALGREGQPLAQADGENLINLRPSTGWKSLEQVRDLALGGSQAKLDALGPYLALDAWVDRKVIVPNLDPSKVGQKPETWAQIRSWRTGGPAPGFERINGRVVGRAPVSLAWARRRRPALIALLAGLKGAYLDDSTAEVSPLGAPEFGVLDTSRIGTLREAEIRLDWSQATDDCRTAADWILSSTTEVGTWEQWNAFCDGIPMTGTSELPQAKRDLLKSGFNPNSDLNKTNPEPSLARLVDKGDLLAYSTEWSLAPPGGGGVACTGRLLDARGRLMSSRTLSMHRTPASAFRLTTQGELVAGNLGALDLAGDESAFRAYGDPLYISESQGPGRTFGHAFPLDRGMALQTWPEPHTVPVPAWYDGQLKLATVETATATSMLFLAHWASGFDSDDAGGITPNAPVAWEAGLTPQSPLFGSAGIPPALLMADGLYLEKGDLANGGQRARTPAYPMLGNVNGVRGTISFWVKPSYTTSSPRMHTYVNATLSDDFGGPTFLVGFTPSSAYFPLPGPSWGVMYRTSTYDIYERKNHLQPTQPSLRRRWNLLTYCWNMEEAATNSSMLYADRGQAPYASGPCQNSDDMICIGPSVTVEDFTSGNNKFHLGRGLRHSQLPETGRWSWPDATLDEFAVYDFGPLTAQAQTDSQAAALQRFEDGRFYKESAYAGLGAAGNTAGEWFSAPLNLGPVRLTGISWSEVVPRGLRAPAGARPEDGDPGPDGGILLELTNAAGGAYLPGPQPRDPSFTPLGRRVDAAIRLHAVFQPNLADPMNTAIVDPLALDDVTVSYRPLDRSPFTDWRVGE